MKGSRGEKVCPNPKCPDYRRVVQTGTYCPSCGHLMRSAAAEAFDVDVRIHCTVCNGTGRINESQCDHCGGSGWI